MTRMKILECRPQFSNLFIVNRNTYVDVLSDEWRAVDDTGKPADEHEVHLVLEQTLKELF